jgi:hypothetical protein
VINPLTTKGVNKMKLWKPESVDDILIGARKYIARLEAVSEANASKAAEIRAEVDRLHGDERDANEEARRATKLRDKFVELISV